MPTSARGITDANITQALNQELARIRREVRHADWPPAVTEAYRQAAELRARLDARRTRGRRRPTFIVPLEHERC